MRCSAWAAPPSCSPTSRRRDRAARLSDRAPLIPALPAPSAPPVTWPSLHLRPSCAFLLQILTWQVDSCCRPPAGPAPCVPASTSCCTTCACTPGRTTRAMGAWVRSSCSAASQQLPLSLLQAPSSRCKEGRSPSAAREGWLAAAARRSGGDAAVQGRRAPVAPAPFPSICCRLGPGRQPAQRQGPDHQWRVP
jgi:hypothetical protein